jgi:hypothetical protein
VRVQRRLGGGFTEKVFNKTVSDASTFEENAATGHLAPHRAAQGLNLFPVTGDSLGRKEKLP